MATRQDVCYTAACSWGGRWRAPRVWGSCAAVWRAVNGQLCWLTEEAAQGCRVHEGALCVPAVHTNMHAISDFLDWNNSAQTCARPKTLSLSRLRQKTERYHVLITHLESVTCVNSTRANIAKYLILNIIKRSSECGVYLVLFVRCWRKSSKLFRKRKVQYS